MKTKKLSGAGNYLEVHNSHFPDSDKTYFYIGNGKAAGGPGSYAGYHVDYHVEVDGNGSRDIALTPDQVKELVAFLCDLHGWTVEKEMAYVVRKR